MWPHQGASATNTHLQNVRDISWKCRQLFATLHFPWNLTRACQHQQTSRKGRSSKGSWRLVTHGSLGEKSDAHPMGKGSMLHLHPEGSLQCCIYIQSESAQFCFAASYAWWWFSILCCCFYFTIVSITILQFMMLCLQFYFSSLPYTHKGREIDREDLIICPVS